MREKTKKKSNLPRQLLDKSKEKKLTDEITSVEEEISRVH